MKQHYYLAIVRDKGKTYRELYRESTNLDKKCLVRIEVDLIVSNDHSTTNGGNQNYIEELLNSLFQIEIIWAELEKNLRLKLKFQELVSRWREEWQGTKRAAEAEDIPTIHQKLKSKVEKPDITIISNSESLTQFLDFYYPSVFQIDLDHNNYSQAEDLLAEQEIVTTTDIVNQLKEEIIGGKAIALLLLAECYTEHFKNTEIDFHFG